MMKLELYVRNLEVFIIPYIFVSHLFKVIVFNKKIHEYYYIKNIHYISKEFIKTLLNQHFNLITYFFSIKKMTDTVTKVTTAV